MLSALTGLLLGAWHVVSGPDHLAAVTPLVLGPDHAHGPHAPLSKDRGHARVGLAWGLGHASGVWLVGLVLLAFGSLIPLELVGVWSERIVGVAIVAVGIWGLWRVRTNWASDESHDDHDHAQSHHHHAGAGSRSALGIGLIHGVAGSSHLYGLLPALALAASERVSYLIGFGIGSIVAMGLFAGLLGLVVGRLPGSKATVRRWTLLVASVAAVIIGTAWVFYS
jgi:ABC-type nickel/cobalt efflux system permease component RcnA